MVRDTAMTRSGRRIKRNVSSTSEFHRLAASRSYFFLRVSSRSLNLHITTQHFYAHSRRGSGLPRKREVPRGTVCFLAICRTVNFERVACMARALLQDGNGSWLNVEGGRRTSTESRESKLNSKTVVRARAIPEKEYLTGGWWPPGESTDLPRTAPCGSWRTIATASYGISEIPIVGSRLCTSQETLITKFVLALVWLVVLISNAITISD